MLERELIELAKKNLLEKKYGKFDWIEKLLDQDELMYQKPRMIRDRIAEVLNIEKEKIPYQTFYSWLMVLRKYWADGFGQEKNNREDSINENLKQTIEMPWKSFRPTVPVSDVHNTTEPILKTVEHPQ